MQYHRTMHCNNRTRQAVKATRLDCLVVATDDHRILHACQAEGIPVVSTSITCNNGVVIMDVTLLQWNQGIHRH